jgi:hypothetical protein
MELERDRRGLTDASRRREGMVRNRASRTTPTNRVWLRPLEGAFTLPAVLGESGLGGRAQRAEPLLRPCWEARALVFRASRARGVVSRTADVPPRCAPPTDDRSA